MKKGLLSKLSLVSTGFIFFMSAAINSSAANLALYTDYDSWLAAVNTSSQNLEVSTFETNYTNVSNEEHISPFQQLPPPSDPDYLTIRTETSFDGNNVNLGKHATFKTGTTGFDISFEVTATEAADARIYYNDIPFGKTPDQVDSFTDVLSIGKFNGFTDGDHDWDNDDFTLEITSNDAVYGIGFDLVNNKQNIIEWLKIYSNKTDTQSQAIFDQGDIPGYTGSYESNFDDVRFIGIVSDTPFSWLEFNEGDSVNDIGLKNFRFATPLPNSERLIINSTGEGSGSFSISPTGIDCGTSSTICFDYVAGTNVTITATPTSSSTFSSWSGCESTDNQSCSVAMTEPRNITADFGNIPDADNDSIPDASDNCPAIANPNQANSDDDSAGNLCDAFPNNSSETKDSDSDGMGNNFETAYGFDPDNASDASQDLDGDGLTNFIEFEANNDPSNINDPQIQATVFWRNSITGKNNISFINEDGFIQNTELNTLSSQWRLAGTGDFDGDNEKDLLWRNTQTGENQIHLLNGTHLQQNIHVNTVADNRWNVAGVADFNGDGKDDILWRHSDNGRVWIYLMNGTTINQSLHVAFTGSDWAIEGTGDFDGDGKGDILWRNELYGRVWMYRMNGANIQTSAHVAFSGSDWDIKTTGDFNNDGKEDILWRNEISGTNWMYLMNGFQITQNTQLNTLADLNWKAVQTEDFNKDGKADLLWRNNVTGENLIYLLNGISITNSQPVDPISDTKWQVAPVID